MKYTRVFALLLSIIMLTGCAEPAVTAPPTQATTPTESTAAEVTIPETTEAPTQLTETEPPATEPVETDPPETEPPATEPPIPLSTLMDKDLVRIADYIPNIAQDLRYATTDNFTGKVIYEFTDAYLRCGTLKKLIKAQEILNAQGLGLKIWDGFRPVYAQAMLYEAWPDPTYVSHPVTGYRGHCRGNALDLTLIDLETGEELVMPTDFDDFSAKADRDYADCTEEETANARLLEAAMVSAGFTPYSAEWWHFTDPVSYNVDEYFDPAVISTWKADCDGTIAMRYSPSFESSTFIHIPDGERFTLLGWAGKFAYVRCWGYSGYVLSTCIQPEASPALSIVDPTDTYTYEQMTADIALLADTYPDIITVGSIGQSEDGQDIPVILLGDADAEHHVLLQGTVHAVEYMCSWLLMAMTEYHAVRGGSANVCFHIIPMMNPDGVALCQSRTLNELQESIYASDKASGYANADREHYIDRWKANGHGVDINRNFDTGWALTSSRPGPSSALYKGTEPFSTAEAAALRDYTLSRDFDVTISYHAMGCLLYWQYGTRADVNSESLSLAQALRSVTGYTPMGSYGLDAAGYKDWAMDVLGIPSVTVEIGCGDLPVAYDELHSIFARNAEVLRAIAQWVTNRQNAP